MSAIQSTYKSNDVEETLDKLFYRPLGYRAALVAKALKLTPNSVTILSIITGVIAGVCFYYRDTHMFAAGALLLILSETLDSADGQLARMTRQFSKIGRILDGVATSVMYLSVYIFLCARMIGDGFPIWIALVAIASGASHSIQCNIADFYRNIYLRFADNDGKGEFIPSDIIKTRMSREDSLFEKIMMKALYSYTQTQEKITKDFQKLLSKIAEMGDNLPSEFYKDYKSLNRPNIKYYNFMTANARMLALIISVWLDKPWLFFAFELVVLNSVLVSVIVKQKKIAKKLSYYCIVNE